jgi:hypothetical protein
MESRRLVLPRTSCSIFFFPPLPPLFHPPLFTVLLFTVAALTLFDTYVSTGGLLLSRMRPFSQSNEHSTGQNFVDRKRGISSICCFSFRLSAVSVSYVDCYDVFGTGNLREVICPLVSALNLWYRMITTEVSIATGCGLGRPGIDFRQGQEIFVYSTASRPALRPSQSPIQWVPGALSPGVKRLGREADHPPPSSAEVSGGAVSPLPDTSSWCSA